MSVSKTPDVQQQETAQSKPRPSQPAPKYLARQWTGCQSAVAVASPAFPDAPEAGGDGEIRTVSGVRLLSAWVTKEGVRRGERNRGARVWEGVGEAGHQEGAVFTCIAAITCHDPLEC